MPPKTDCQEYFELVTSDWGLEYDRDENGCYSDYQTGVVFGSFELGWISHQRKIEGKK
jgi:hypothetical protein